MLLNQSLTIYYTSFFHMPCVYCVYLFFIHTIPSKYLHFCFVFLPRFLPFPDVKYQSFTFIIFGSKSFFFQFLIQWLNFSRTFLTFLIEKKMPCEIIWIFVSKMCQSELSVLIFFDYRTVLWFKCSCEESGTVVIFHF